MRDKTLLKRLSVQLRQEPELDLGEEILLSGLFILLLSCSCLVPFLYLRYYVQQMFWLAFLSAWPAKVKSLPTLHAALLLQEESSRGFFLRRNHYLLSVQLDDEWPESIFHHVGNQSASYPVSV